MIPPILSLFTGREVTPLPSSARNPLVSLPGTKVRMLKIRDNLPTRREGAALGFLEVSKKQEFIK